MYLSYVSAVLAVGSMALAKEMPVDKVKAAELYDSGLQHETLMASEEMPHDGQRTFSKQSDAGAYQSDKYAKLESFVPCVGGLATAIPRDANNTFRCNNIDLYDFKSHADLGSKSGRGSSSWGWTSPDGRELLAIGQSDGAAFAEITGGGKLVYLGRLPQYSTPIIWREIRAYKNYMIIGSEAEGHNIQIFDMAKAKEYAVSVGAQPRSSPYAAGLIFIDLKDVSNPTTPGCDPQDGCDVTNRPNSTVISRTSYQDAAYTHQGWLLDTEWQEFLFIDDEYDEYDEVEPGVDGHPVTYIWNVSSLAAPLQTGYYKSESCSIDHNQYIREGRSYQSNYGGGLRVLDVSSIRNDPTGKSVKEIGFFDIYPEDDHKPNGGVIDFVDSWSSYAYFKSGYIFVNTMERGGFVVKFKEGVL